MMYFSFRKSKDLEFFKSWFLKFFHLLHKFCFTDKVILPDLPLCHCMAHLGWLVFFLAGSFGLWFNCYRVLQSLTGRAVSPPLGLLSTNFPVIISGCGNCLQFPYPALLTFCRCQGNLVHEFETSVLFIMGVGSILIAYLCFLYSLVQD